MTDEIAEEESFGFGATEADFLKSLDDYRKAHPWRCRFGRMAHLLHEAKWWVIHRFHPSHRYHVIRTGLKPGWVDRDFLMAHLIVKCLIDFVEKEKPFEHFDTEDSHHREEWIKLKSLYDFFKACDLREFDYKCPEELNGKLIEVIKIRQRMWT